MLKPDLGAISEPARRFLQDVSAYSIAAVVPAILSLVSLTIFTRVFDPTAFGRYSLAVAIVGVASTLLFGWIDRSVIRFAPEMDERNLIGTVFGVVLIIEIAVLLIAGGGYVVLHGSLGAYQPFYVATVAYILAQGLFQPLVVLFQATLKARLVSLFRSVNALVKLVASVILAVFVFGHITGWIWGSVVAILLTIGVMVVTFSKLRTLPKLRRSILLRMSGYGLPMIGWIIGDPLLNQADRILLELIKGSAQVGVYASNYSIVDRGLRLTMIPLLDAIQPLVINAWEGDNPGEVEQLIERYSRYFFILAVPPLILIGALSRPLSGMLLGEEFHAGYVVIPIVGVGVFLWSLANLGQVGLEIRERTALMSRGLLGAVVFNVIIDIPLIFQFGYMGAAVGTMLSYGVYVVFVMAFSRDQIHWVLPIRTVVNTTVAGAIMAVGPAALYVTGAYTLPRILITAGFSPILYLLVLYLSGEITQHEIAHLRSMV